jgi:hypothetical protein
LARIAFRLFLAWLVLFLSGHPIAQSSRLKSQSGAAS